MTASYIQLEALGIFPMVLNHSCSLKPFEEVLKKCIETWAQFNEIRIPEEFLQSIYLKALANSNVQPEFRTVAIGKKECQALDTPLCYVLLLTLHTCPDPHQASTLALFKPKHHFSSIP